MVDRIEQVSCKYGHTALRSSFTALLETDHRKHKVEETRCPVCMTVLVKDMGVLAEDR